MEMWDGWLHLNETIVYLSLAQYKHFCFVDVFPFFFKKKKTKNSRDVMQHTGLHNYSNLKRMDMHWVATGQILGYEYLSHMRIVINILLFSRHNNNKLYAGNE